MPLGVGIQIGPALRKRARQGGRGSEDGAGANPGAREEARRWRPQATSATHAAFLLVCTEDEEELAPKRGLRRWREAPQQVQVCRSH